MLALNENKMKAVEGKTGALIACPPEKEATRHIIMKAEKTKKICHLGDRVPRPYENDEIAPQINRHYQAMAHIENIEKIVIMPS